MAEEEPSVFVRRLDEGIQKARYVFFSCFVGKMPHTFTSGDKNYTTHNKQQVS